MSLQPRSTPIAYSDHAAAIMLRRAARGEAIPADAARRMDPEWRDGLVAAQTRGDDGIARFLASCESRLRDDQDRLTKIQEALAASVTDPGGEPGDDGRMPDDPLRAEWPPVRMAGMPRVPPFPVDVFPVPVADFIEAASKAFNCPADFVALPALVVAGAAIGRSASLMLKRGYFASAALYGMSVGGPSSGKSPGCEAAVRPLLEADESLLEAYKSQKLAFEVEMADHLKVPPKIRGAPPAKPIVRSAVVIDTTAEAVVTHLGYNPRGLLNYQDEGSGWVRGLNQYKNGNGADRQFWLSLLYGKTLRVDRKSNADHEPIRVAHPFMSVIGNIPPDMLGELVDVENRSDGFVERLVFAVPDPLPRAYWSDDGLSGDLADRWSDVIRRLRAREMRIEGAQSCPHVVRFAGEARERWIAWYNEFVDEVNQPGFNQADLASEVKLQDFAARFILILHLLDHASDPTAPDDPIPDVSIRAVEGGIALWEYFRSHQRRIKWYMSGGMPDPASRAVIDWARRTGRDSFTVRDAAADLRWMRVSAQGPEGILDRMATRNLIRLRPEPVRPTGKAGRKPSPTYEVHPDLLRRPPGGCSTENRGFRVIGAMGEEESRGGA